MTDIIQQAYLLKEKIGILPISEYWKDIGNLKDFKAAEITNNHYFYKIKIRLL